MKKNLPDQKINTNYLIIFLYLIFICLISQVSGQITTISGRVTSDRWPVNEAQVTFIDESDTTINFSTMTDDLGNYQIELPTSVHSNINTLPADFELAQNYPNPFSALTAIPYSVQNRSDIKITIYDILGREVRKFMVGVQTAGSHKIVWDGRNSFDQRVANGIYLYKLETEGKSQVKKMIL